MPTIHPTDYQQINAMLGVQSPPKELEQEYFTRLRMLQLAGVDGPLGPVALVDLIRSLGFDPAEEPLPCVPWERYPADGTIRVEARWRIGNEDKWLSGVFRGVVGQDLIAVQMESEPIARHFLSSEVRLAADQAAPQRDIVSPNQPDLIDASGAPCDMEVPDIGPDDPTILSIRQPAHEEFDWCLVGAGRDVFVREGSGEIVGSMMAVAGNSLLLQVQGEPEPRWFDSDLCALERD